MASITPDSRIAGTGKPQSGPVSPLSQRDADRAAIREVLLQVLSGDVSEIVGHRRGACRHCFGRGFRHQWRDATEYAAALRAHLRTGGPRPDHGGGTGYTRDRDPFPDCPHCEGQGVSYLEVVDTLQMPKGHRMLVTAISQTRDGVALRFADRIAAARLLVQLDQRTTEGRRAPHPGSTAGPGAGSAPGLAQESATRFTIQVPAKAPVADIRRPYRREEV